MCFNRKVLRTMLGAALTLPCISGALAVDDPNANYSSLIVSYRSITFATPVCIGTECHSSVAGPSVVFSHQLIPNFALGISGSSLRSDGTASVLKSSFNSVFMEVVAGIGRAVDVGASVAVLRSTVESCTINPSACTARDDTGRDLGVFTTFFLNDASSISLSYDALAYQNASDQTVIGLSLVSILAEHHRLSFSADQIQNAGGKAVSGGYGFGYSYLF
jgi:hypothetical protein